MATSGSESESIESRPLRERVSAALELRLQAVQQAEQQLAEELALAGSRRHELQLATQESNDSSSGSTTPMPLSDSNADSQSSHNDDSDKDKTVQISEKALFDSRSSSDSYDRPRRRKKSTSRPVPKGN